MELVTQGLHAVCIFVYQEKLVICKFVLALYERPTNIFVYAVLLNV